MNGWQDAVLALFGGSPPPKACHYPYLLQACISSAAAMPAQTPEGWPVGSTGGLSLLFLFFIFRRRGREERVNSWPSSAPPKNKKQIGIWLDAL